MNDKRLLILNSLDSIINTKRYHEVKIDDIAKKCRIGKGTVYTYFKSKEEMFFELVIHGIESQITEMEKIYNSELTAKQKLVRVAEKLSIYFCKRHGATRIMHQLEHRQKFLTKKRKDKLLSTRIRMRKGIEQILEDCIQEQSISHNYQPEQLAQLFIHTLIGRSHWDKDIEAIPVEDLINIIFFQSKQKEYTSL